MAGRLGVTVHAIVSIQSINMTIDAINSVRDGIPCTDTCTLNSSKEINLYNRHMSTFHRRSGVVSN